MQYFLYFPSLLCAKKPIFGANTRANEYLAAFSEYLAAFSEYLAAFNEYLAAQCALRLAQTHNRALLRSRLSAYRLHSRKVLPYPRASRLRSCNRSPVKKKFLAIPTKVTKKLFDSTAIGRFVRICTALSNL